MKVQATLVEVHGDQMEFADLIGETGTLHLSKANGLNWFMPNNRGDTLEMVRKRASRKGDKISVRTALGNRFVFQTATPKQES